MLPMQSFAESSTVERLLEQQRQMMREQREYEEKKMAEMEAKLHAKDAQMEQQRAEMERLREAARPRMAEQALPEARLEALQTRVHALHAAGLLKDEELYTIENDIADLIESRPTMLASHPMAQRVVKMALLSESMVVDGSFARQLQRRLA
jgi:chromosome segregation ATPase